jgi:hypothetical protein
MGDGDMARRGPRRTYTKDLHGLSVAAAEHAVRTVMERIHTENSGGTVFSHKVNFICGRGNHSDGLVPRIRPAVLWLVQELGCNRRIMDKNPGIVEVLPRGMDWDDLPPLGKESVIIRERRNGSTEAMSLGRV